MNYEFAERIKDRLLANPKKLFMHRWIAQISPEMLNDLKKSRQLSDRTALECGTVGCIAGHCCFEARKPDARGWEVAVFARNELGISSAEAMMLFFFHEPSQIYRLLQYFGSNPYADLTYSLKNTAPGTIPYAQICAAAIDRCIERHRSGEAQRHDQGLSREAKSWFNRLYQ